MRPGLEQQHVAAALRELARDDTAPGARSDHDDVELVPHPIPRYDQSFSRPVTGGGAKSISAHAPDASRPGATKSL